MPVSKHYKKGLTARQWRKRRNRARTQIKMEHKAAMRQAMAKMMQEQIITKAEKEAEEKDEN